MRKKNTMSKNTKQENSVHENSIIHVTKKEFDRLVQDAVTAAISIQPKSKFIKGTHELAIFLNVSLSRAQQLKNEGVFPYFQDDRTVLFDPDKVREVMATYNLSHKKIERNKPKSSSKPVPSKSSG
jgi:hypothetical protein